MDFHIDRRVILSEESEYKNLYDWSLKEIDGDGKQVGRDLIPWAWGVSFTARNLVLTETLSLSSEMLSSSSDDGDSNTKREATKRQSIRATLRPWDLEPYCQTGFSMFGTGRALSKFDLVIYKLQEGDGEERCVAWGSVSYTSEIDFREDTTDDVLIFNLFICSDRFARYAERIAGRTVDEVVFRVRGVAGFYSDWSPSITADSIKVLTNSEEHKIQNPDDCTIKPPRLGEVAEAELHFHRIIRLERTETKETDEDEEPVVGPPLEEPDISWEREEPIPAASPVHHGLLKVMDERVVKLLSSLRFAAWGIAFLLLLLLFK